VFLVGVYVPAWDGVPFSGDFQGAVAIVGAGVAVFGFTLAWDSRQAIRNDPRRRPLPDRAKLVATFGPNVEVYQPGPRSAEPGEEPQNENEA
jgi:hypothetical protein